jgi:hypothetical protein
MNEQLPKLRLDGLNETEREMTIEIYEDYLESLAQDFVIRMERDH